MDLGDAIINVLKIRCKKWPPDVWIAPNTLKTGWLDMDMEDIKPAFQTMEDWEFYIEPKKQVERTFYKPLIYVGGTGIFYTGDHWAIDRAHNLLPNEQIVEWYERKFTPPE